MPDPHATPDRVRWLVMELGHADVCGTYSNLDDAKAALASIIQLGTDDEDEYGIVEVDEAGWPVGEVIR